MKFTRFYFVVPILVVLANSCNAQFTEEDLIIDVPALGKIAGRNTTTVGYTPRPYIAFQGIKYADSPEGDGRFQPSIRFSGPLNETGDTFYAYDAGVTCIQPLSDNQGEDCLTINVYTRKPYKGNDSDLLPVIFYIHGGSFTIGNGAFFNGNRILNRDVVLVSFNYRLGVLGFFSLGTESVPGNAGMYDIVNALKWTNEYVKYFGGDPNKITIAGQSAGSVAVTHLLVSPMAKGLFQGAIGASGTALAAWGTTENPIRGSLLVSEIAGCYNSSNGYPDDAMLQNITTCMRNVDTFTLWFSLYQYQVAERRQGRLGFDQVSPVIQSFNTSSSFVKFLPENPKAVFEAGKQADVPLMMGTTRHDGSYVLGVYYNRYIKDNNLINDTEFMTERAIPLIMTALGITNEYGVYDSIAKVYLGDSRKSGDFFEMYPGLIDLFSVFFFKASSYQTALYQSRLNNDTYWYSFDFQGTESVWGTSFGIDGPPPFNGGITHGDDLNYLFSVTPTNFTEVENSVSNRMLDYWANFATTGNPTPVDSNLTVWNRLTSSDAKFLSIGANSSEYSHYDDSWSGVGWEVVPPPEPSTTEVVPTSTVPSTSSSTPTSTSVTNTPTTSDPGTGASGFLTSCTFLITFLSLCSIYFTS